MTRSDIFRTQNESLCRRMGATRGALTWRCAAAAGDACCAAGTQRRKSAEAVTRSIVGCQCALAFAAKERCAGKLRGGLRG
jgi:hypothetical protein